MPIAEPPRRSVERAGRAVAPRPSAAVWINSRSAIIALMGDDGQVSTCEIDRGVEPEQSFLAIVVRAIGDRERVLIIGPGAARLALEREYVSIYQRPDRLVDVEPGDALDRVDLVRRLCELAA
jgi:hypothetical protein